MTSCVRRHAREILFQSARRIAAFLIALLILAGLWWVARPAIIYRLACANLGNYRAAHLIERAVIERYPQIAWSPAAAESIYAPWSSRLQSFDSGRRRFAIGSPSADGGNETKWLVFDERLDRVGSIRTANTALAAPDDRDGDRAIELLLHCYDVSSGGTRNFQCVARLGQERHGLLAVIEQTITTTAPVVWAWPMWTNSERDSQHELEWVSWGGAGPTPTWTSALKLRWLSPGRMTYDGPLPAGYKVWLAQSPDEVTFSPDESLDEVARRALGK